MENRWNWQHFQLMWPIVGWTWWSQVTVPTGYSGVNVFTVFLGPTVYSGDRGRLKAATDRSTCSDWSPGRCRPWRWWRCRMAGTSVPVPNRRTLVAGDRWTGCIPPDLQQQHTTPGYNSASSSSCCMMMELVQTSVMHGIIIVSLLRRTTASSSSSKSTVIAGQYATLEIVKRYWSWDGLM